MWPQSIASFSDGAEPQAVLQELLNTLQQLRWATLRMRSDRAQSHLQPQTGQCGPHSGWSLAIVFPVGLLLLFHMPSNAGIFSANLERQSTVHIKVNEDDRFQEECRSLQVFRRLNQCFSATEIRTPHCLFSLF